jgi:hypothetical protein
MTAVLVALAAIVTVRLPAVTPSWPASRLRPWTRPICRSKRCCLRRAPAARGLLKQIEAAR